MIIKTISFEINDRTFEVDVHFHLIEGQADPIVPDEIEIKKIEVWYIEGFDLYIDKKWFDNHLAWHKAVADYLDNYINSNEDIIMELIELCYE